MFSRVSILILFALAMLAGKPLHAEAKKIFYPKPETHLDERSGFPLTLLHLVFERIESGAKYQLVQTPIAMPRGRALTLLEQNVVVDIIWSITSKAREKVLLPIRLPIYQQMMGWRVLLIRKGERARYPVNNTLQALRKMVTVQALDWADLKILQSNQFKVKGAANYEELFAMVGSGQGDFFPRSVVEVMSETPYIDKYNLEIEPTLLLKYPAAMYFFVNKHNTELAADIEKGFNRALNDGSFELLFTSVHSDALKKLQVSKRKIFNLNNPFFPNPE